MAVKKTATEEIVIPAIDIRKMKIKIVGDTPLIMHKWDEKAKQMILDKEMGKAKNKGHEIKSPIADFIHSVYWMEGEPDLTKCKTEEDKQAVFETAIKKGARFGFPTCAFKASAVAAGFRSGVSKNKVSLNGAFHIDTELTEIHGTPKIREDMVRVGMGAADIRYRGEFKKWWAELEVKYNAGTITAEQVVNLFSLGGFACGIGEWRAEKGGINGAYHVE